MEDSPTQLAYLDEVLRAEPGMEVAGAHLSAEAALAAGHWPEVQVLLRLVAAGQSYKEIAAELKTSQNTVHAHVKHICGKLHAASRPEALLRRPKASLPPRLAGARIRVCGVVLPLFNKLHQATSAGVFVHPAEEFKVLAEGPESPAEIPRTLIRRLLQYDPQPSDHQSVRLAGTVTAVLSQQIFFIQDESGGVRVRRYFQGPPSGLPGLGIQSSQGLFPAPGWSGQPLG